MNVVGIESLDRVGNTYTDRRGRRASLVSVAGTDIDACDPHTEASIRCVYDMLRASKERVNKAEFQKLETESGFNYVASGVLALMQHVARPTQTTMWDWMHLILVDGCFNNVAGKLMQRIAPRFKYRDVYAWVTAWSFPSRLKYQAASAMEVFGRKRAQPCFKEGKLKTTASEGLCIYRILQEFIMTVVIPAGVALAECNCYVTLCVLLGLLQICARGTVTPAELRSSVVEFLHRYYTTFGDKGGLKMHCLLHLPAMMGRCGFLLSCFVHERKHKSIKRWMSGRLRLLLALV
jgi:hypothetical protein